MRARIVILAAVLAVRVAHAESVVVMAEPGAQLDGALRVAMAGRGVDVAAAPTPSGALRLERAAVAQRTALQAGADAAVWIDDAEVCAVSADGHDFRHAPFPIEAASPRAFAAIATSLLDEMIRPEPWMGGFDVNVNVEVTPHDGRGPRVAFAGPPGETMNVVDAVPPATEGRAHAGHTLIEIGPMVSPLTAGIQGAVAFGLSPAWRLAGTLAINKTWDGDYTLGVGSVELRHIGVGLAKHWDIGPEVGYASDGTDPVGFAGVRLARTWELTSTAVSLAFSPLLFVPLAEVNTPPVFPAIYASMRWQVPL